MVKAEENDPDALLAALKSGRMYSSTGPQIHRVTWKARAVDVECSPAVTVAALGPGSAAAVVDGLSMTRLTLPFGRLAGAPWMRRVVTDAACRKAWTNPVFPG